MSEQEATPLPEELARKAEEARCQSRALRAESAEMARQVAKTEDFVADTMDRLAAQHPDNARRFRAKGQAAREQASKERRALQRRRRHARLRWFARSW